MNDFFTTLFKWNWANVGKAVVGAATGLAAYPELAATLPMMPTGVIIVASVVLGVASALGLHNAHRAEPPQPPLGK